MAIEASIKTALASIAGGRVYPDTTPDNPTFPCVTYQQVGGEVLNQLEGGDPGKDHARRGHIIGRAHIHQTNGLLH